VLTPELLRKVFAIRALELQHGTAKVIVPWSVEPPSA
jgi:hypothetical protein